MDKEKLIAKRYTYTRCGLLYLVFFVLGMSNSIVGPSIPDMARRLDVTLEQVGFAFSANAFSWLAATLVMGLVADRVLAHCDALLGVLLMVLHAALLSMPYAPVLPFFIGAFAVVGLMDASLDIVCNVVLLSLWKEGSDVHFQAMYCTWSLGSVIAPFIIRPFLSDGPYTEDANSTTTPTPELNISMTFSEYEESRIEYAYIIVSMCGMVVALASLGLYIFGDKSHRVSNNIRVQSPKDMFNLTKSAEASAKFAVPMCLLFMLYYFFVAGAEMTLFTWVFTYAVESDLEFSEPEAATLDAAGKAAYLIGRVGDIMLAKYIPIQLLLFSTGILASAAGVLLALVGPLSKTNLYVTVCTYQFLIAALWPGGVSFLDKYLKVVAAVYMFSNLGASTAAMFFQWFCGYLFTESSPESVLVVVAGCTILAVCVLSAMQALGSVRGNRYRRELHVEESDHGEAVSSKWDEQCSPGVYTITN